MITIPNLKPKESLALKLWLVPLVILTVLSYTYIITKVFNEVTQLVSTDIPTLTMGVTYLFLLLMSIVKFCMTPLNSFKDLVDGSEKLTTEEKLKNYTIQVLTAWILYGYYNLVYYFLT